jgi:hypothetical protein
MNSSFRLLVAAAAAATFGTPAAGDELDDALRSAFQLPSGVQIVWPPRFGLAAGSLIDSALTVVGTEAGQADHSPIGAAPMAIRLPPERLQPLDGFWLWRSYLADTKRIAVKLTLSEMEVLTWNSSGGSQQPFVRQPDAARLKASGAVVPVSRSWVARANLEITPGPELPQADWLSMRKVALGDQTHTVRYDLTVNSIVLAIPDKVSVAIDYGSGAPAQKSGREGSISGPKRWALATIASGRYQFLAGMDQEWNAHSADLVVNALSDWRPSITRALRPADSLGLSRQGVLSFLDRFAQDAKKAGAQLLVVYYVGHMERTGTGALSLLMGDAPMDREIRPPAPATGIGNLRAIMQIVDQAQAQLAPQPGSLDVAVIHRQLGLAKLPFVLLVDGCLEDPIYAAARERLGIFVDAHGGEPIYVGPGDAGSALREQIAKLQSYPQDFPWLKSKDPTILGATPGTVAYAEPDPIWLLGTTVGPIARHLFDVVTRTRWNSDRPNLIRVLDFAADRQSIGPQELVGTVSWSDWLPYLRKFDPASFKN